MIIENNPLTYTYLLLSLSIWNQIRSRIFNYMYFGHPRICWTGTLFGAPEMLEIFLNVDYLYYWCLVIYWLPLLYWKTFILENKIMLNIQLLRCLPPPVYASDGTIFLLSTFCLSGGLLTYLKSLLQFAFILKEKTQTTQDSLGPLKYFKKSIGPLV